MYNTKYIYAVHSDIDENNIYAEFDTEAKAFEYARRNIDDLTWIERLEVNVDEDGEIVSIIDAETIWVYLDDEDESTKEVDEDDFFAFKDDVRTEKLEDLVETLEENEDMVECKECFDLFPKEECTKLDVGYICPHCHNAKEADIDAVVVIADEDLFKLEFPEVEKFSNENEMIPSEPHAENDPISTAVSSVSVEEIIDALVKDEKEAIAGYEQAEAAIAANEELPADTKEDILDTILHIKEEEVEHIDELTEVVADEIVKVENDPLSNEEKVEESDKEEVEEIEDPESETLNEGTKSETKYWMCFYDNNDVAVIEAADEDAAMNTFMNDYNDEYFFDSWDHDWSVEEISKEEYDEWKKIHNLEEHVNEEHPAIESEQELEGTDNAVVDCKVADVVTHSEDEKPVDCEGEKKPLEKPLTESSLLQGSLEISDTESLSWGWDKNDGFYVEKLWRPSADAAIWNTEFRRTYRTEADARRAFNRYAKQFSEALAEDTHAQYAKPEGDRVRSYNNALNYANKEGKPFIYGYTNRAGKFFALEQPIKVTSEPVEAERKFRAQYKNCNVVYTVFPNNPSVK